MTPGCRSAYPVHSETIRRNVAGFTPVFRPPGKPVAPESAMLLRDAPLPPSGHPGTPRARASVRFDLGRLYVTSNAMAVLPSPEIVGALARHARGDWGTLCQEDWQANDRALLDGDRLVSVYHTAAGVKFYVITEWNRSVTTVLLPEDY